MESSCCRNSDEGRGQAASCPGCGEKGRRVGLATVQAILKPGLAIDRGDGAFRFCSNPGCDHLYFDGDWIARTSDARVRVGIKENVDPILLCYCFGFTRADVRADVRATGTSSIPERIAAEIRAGNCACEVKNPSGACCLGEVRKSVEEARASAQLRGVEEGEGT